MSDQEIQALRALVLSKRDGAKKRYSIETRTRLLVYLSQQWSKGTSSTRLSEDLGISKSTLCLWKARWAEPDQGKGQLRRVEVIGEKTVASRKGGSLVLHGPAGTRLEGLCRDDVVEIWRRLS